MHVITKVYVEYTSVGYDRPYTRTEEITGKSADADIKAWHESLRTRKGEDEVTFYQTYQVTQVRMPDGETLTGKPRKHGNITYFGTARAIPNTPYPNTVEDVLASGGKMMGDDAEWTLRNAQKVHAIYQRELQNGKTHIVHAQYAGVIFINQRDGVRVFDRDSGEQVWPPAGQKPGAATKPTKPQPKP